MQMSKQNKTKAIFFQIRMATEAPTLQLLNFVLFLLQRRDDHVPILLLKPIKEIRNIFNEKIEAAKAALRENEALNQPPPEL